MKLSLFMFLNIVFLLLIAISEISFVGGQSDLLQCDMMDFNIDFVKPDLYLEKCEWREEFIIRAYSESTIESFRPTSMFYMTNRLEGINCGQTKRRYALDENSEIEIALNFDYVNLGAQLELIVQDMGDNSVVLRSLMNSKTNGWTIHRGEINRVVDEAMVRKS